ncbi:MAG: murein L,D-transpeptidase [Hyphomicrobiales bacterium]
MVSSTRMKRSGLIPVLAAAFCLALAGQARAAADPRVAEHTAWLLQNEPKLALPIRQRMETLSSYYLGKGGAPIWIGTNRMPAFLAVLRSAEDHGLDPKDYQIAYLQKLLDAAAVTDAQSQSVIELIFSAYFLKFAEDLKQGRLLPGKVDPELYWQSKKVDMTVALDGVAASPRPQAFVDAWQPQIPEYLVLRQALAIYRQLAGKGGWPQVPNGDAIKPGEESDRVPALRARLAATDGAAPAAPGANGKLYDAELEEAVKRFQERHGLEPDGVVGTRTVLQMNIPVEDRIRQIVANMERWRWMPEDLGEHYIIVNIAGFELRRIRGKVEEQMRVVVGKPYHRTPVFSEKMTYVELNPYWNVPSSIATKEELPKLKSNPGAAASRGFEVVSGDRVIDPRSVDWSQYSRGNFPFQLRQRPGTGNALGRVKFMFPNRFNVYLHDTPARTLFAKAERAFSHGCIRLARPLDLAEQVLAGEAGWDRKKIDAVVASQERTVVTLSQPIPVHITYATAWLGTSGAVHFAADIYERDEALRRALFGMATAS